MRRLVLLIMLACLVAAPPSASADGPDLAATADLASPYDLSLEALLDETGTNVYLRVSATGGAPIPELLPFVQLKTFALDGGHEETRVFSDVPLDEGSAVIRLSRLQRGQVVEAHVHVKADSQHNLWAEAAAALRPDFELALEAPAEVLRRETFDVAAEISEVAGDTGGEALVTLFDGEAEIGVQRVAVEAGGTATVAFSLRFDSAGEHGFRALVSDAQPSETNVSNNAAEAETLVRMYAHDGVVATDSALATEIGVEILKRGGNAIDAAAAVQFALNVTQPHLSGIGGGSTILVHLADGQRFAIDAREIAPAATTRTTYRFTREDDNSLSGFSVGVPGSLRAVEVMLDRWGTMSLAQTIGPAIDLAENGFPVGTFLARDSGDPRVTSFQPETLAIFREADGSPLDVGDLLVQPDLAKTFRLIASQGGDVFYRGEIAAAIVAAQRRTHIPGGEGRMTLEDLAEHEIQIRPPLSVDYRGYEVESMTPSSAGGLIVLQTLQMLERFPLGDSGSGYGPVATKTVHAQLEALRHALADRQFWMGDDRFFPVPVTGLLSDGYTQMRSAAIREDSRIPTVLPGNPLPFETPVTGDEDGTDHKGTETTHFSILDKWGNAVSFTTTLTDSFGSGITVPGYGFVLNDGLTNFNRTPQGNPTTGNPGVNDPGPGKRARGSTAPVIVLDEGEPIMATGTLGGLTIPGLVVQVVSNVLDQGMPIQQAVDAPRFSLNSQQNTANWNSWFPATTIAGLRALGDRFAAAPVADTGLGSASSFHVDLDSLNLEGAADRRLSDASAIVLPRGAAR